MHGCVLVALCLGLILYIVLGSVIFYYIEYEQKYAILVDTVDYQQQFLSNYSCVNVWALDAFVVKMVKAHNSGINVYGKHGPDDMKRRGWTYDAALFFSTSIITTIGYGRSAPVTYGGRITCTIYGIIGIPFFLLVAGSLGSKLMVIIKKLENKIENKFKNSKMKCISTVHVRSIMLMLFGLLLFVFIPAAIFTWIESWDYGESLYYAFITLTTIGFGDYIAGFSTQTQPYYQLFLVCWVLTGLVWIYLMVYSITESCRSLMDKSYGHADDHQGEEETPTYGSLVVGLSQYSKDVFGDSETSLSVNGSTNSRHTSATSLLQ